MTRSQVGVGLVKALLFVIVLVGLGSVLLTDFDLDAGDPGPLPHSPAALAAQAGDIEMLDELAPLSGDDRAAVVAQAVSYRRVVVLSWLADSGGYDAQQHFRHLFGQVIPQGEPVSFRDPEIDARTIATAERLVADGAEPCSVIHQSELSVLESGSASEQRREFGTLEFATWLRERCLG